MDNSAIFIFIAALCMFSLTPYAQEEETVPAPYVFPQGDFSGLQITGAAQIDQIIDPLRLRLSDKRIIQLAPLDIPDMDPYEPGDNTLAAQKFLHGLLSGQQVRLYQNRNRPQEAALPKRRPQLRYERVVLSSHGVDAKNPIAALDSDLLISSTSSRSYAWTM